MEKKLWQTYLKIQNNLYLKFSVISGKGYYEFIGYKDNGTKLSVVIPISSMSLPKAVDSVNETLEKP